MLGGVSTGARTKKLVVNMTYADSMCYAGFAGQTQEGHRTEGLLCTLEHKCLGRTSEATILNKLVPSILQLFVRTRVCCRERQAFCSG